MNSIFFILLLNFHKSKKKIIFTSYRSANYEKVDFWALGITLYTILLKQFPPDFENDEALYLKLQESTITPKKLQSILNT